MEKVRKDTIVTVGRAQDKVSFALADGATFNITPESARRFARMLCDAAHDVEIERDPTGALVTVLDGCEWVTP